MTETWECCSFQLWMIHGARRKLPSFDAAVSPRQGDNGYIIDHRFIMINRYHISHALSEVLKTLPKDPGLFSKCPCLFTLRSRLFALTTDLPGPGDGPLNIVQSNILASGSQNQKPFRMSEGDQSDGNLGVLHIRTLDETRYLRKLPSLDADVSPRQGDDGYIIDHRYHTHKYPFPGAEDSSKRCRPMFKFSMPFHLAIQIVCTDH